jgi:non-ribosomal peptide synthetase component E (peptide arylation enzyme)
VLPGPNERLPGVVYQAGAKLAEYAAAGALTDETLVSAFAEMVRRFPTRHAIVEAEGHCTYAELDLLTDRAAAGFLALGLEPLDRVIFQATNSRELGPDPTLVSPAATSAISR